MDAQRRRREGTRCLIDAAQRLITPRMAARNVTKVSPGDAKDVEADDTKAVPLDEETTREDAIRATLHHLATREPHSLHQTTIYYGLVRPDTPPRR